MINISSWFLLFVLITKIRSVLCLVLNNLKRYNEIMENTSRWIALVGVSLLAFVVFLDFTIINTALPFIQEAFHSSILELQWVVNIFTLVLTVTMVAIGRIADLFGRKKMLYFGVGIFILSAFGAGLSPSINWLTICRGFQGLGVSILFVASSSLISEIFPRKQHGLAVGVYAGITGLGLALGPFLGGVLIEWLSWRWIFWINLPIAVIGWACCAIHLKSLLSVRTDVKIDWKGLVLLITGLGGVVYSIILIASQAIAFTVFWLIFIGGLSLLVLFFMYEKRVKFPLIDLSAFRNISIVLPVLNCFIGGIISCVFMFFDPLYLRSFYQLSALSIGLLITTIPVMQVVMSFLLNPLIRWIGFYNLMYISLIVGTLGIGMHHLIDFHFPFMFLFLPFGLLGITWGISNAGTLFAVNQFISKGKVGVSIGTIFTIWNMIGAVFLAISSAIFHSKQKVSFLKAFHSVIDFNLIVCVLLLAIAGAIFVKWKKVA